jgi:hypothetical protein
MSFSGLARLLPIVAAFLAMAGWQGEALAEPAATRTAGAPTSLAQDPDDESIARQIAALRRQRNDIDRAGPIIFLVLGGTIGLVSLGATQMRGGLGAEGNPPTGSPTGLYIVSGLGFTIALASLIWLVDCNQQRGEIEERIEKLQRRSAFVLPSFDPLAKSAGLSLSGRF